VKLDHQALLKAKYCPRVAAVTCTQKKKTKKNLFKILDVCSKTYHRDNVCQK